MAQWFIVREGREQGPFSAEQMKSMVVTKGLGPDDLVRRDDMAGPVKAAKVKGLLAPSVQQKPVPEQLPDAIPVESPDPPRSTGPKKSRLSRKAIILLSVIGGACLFLCCGGFAIFGIWLQKSSQKQLAEADALWDKGDKSAAVAKYKGIIDDHRLHLLKEEEQARVYGRLIDHEYESGNADTGRALIDKADKDGITPAVSHAGATKYLADLQAEKERIAEAKRKQEEAERKAKEKSREADENTFTVSKGFLSGDVQVRVLVPDEITISDVSLDEWTLMFKLHWKKSIGRPVDPWHYSAFDEKGTKVDGGAVSIPASMELGQKVKARIVLRREDVKEIARIDIHQ